LHGLVVEHEAREAEVRQLGVDVRARAHEGAETLFGGHVQEAPQVEAWIIVAEVELAALALVDAPRHVGLHHGEPELAQRHQPRAPAVGAQTEIVHRAGVERLLLVSDAQHAALEANSRATLRLRLAAAHAWARACCTASMALAKARAPARSSISAQRSTRSSGLISWPRLAPLASITATRAT